MSVTEHYFETRELASHYAAMQLAEALSEDLLVRDEATIIVSGGSTPRDCYKELSGVDLPWSRVHILMSDERYVDTDHPASNEGMVRRELLSGPAAAANMASIFQPGIPVAERCHLLEKDIGNLPQPASAGLLGMGEDGHFASLFPGFDQLDEGLDLNSRFACLPVHTAASQYSRITLTLRCLLGCKELLLLFFGETKRAIYEQSLTGSSYPLARLLQQEQTPVQIIWAS
jgi:6-phosphogluconolactonase